MTNNIEQLEKLVEARKKATAGPWEQSPRRVRKDSVFVGVGGGDPHHNKIDGATLGVGGLVCEGMLRAVDERNMNFIALAGSTDLESILTEMKEQQAKIEKLEKVVEAAEMLVAQADVETADRGPQSLIDFRIREARQALAALGEQP